MKFPLFRYNYNWQYNGVAPYENIRLWCRENFGPEGPTAGNWMSAFETIYFVRQEDYSMFLLRWA